MFNSIKVGVENIDNTNILNIEEKENDKQENDKQENDKQENDKQENDKQENDKCFLFCFGNKKDVNEENINEKKINKIYPFLEFDDNCLNIKIYQYNQNKFLKYYNNSKYHKIIDIDVKNINNFDFNKQDLINNFINTSISKILDKYNKSKIDSISNNLSLQVLQKIYDIYKITKQLNPINEE